MYYDFDKYKSTTIPINPTDMDLVTPTVYTAFLMRSAVAHLMKLNDPKYPDWMCLDFLAAIYCYPDQAVMDHLVNLVKQKVPILESMKLTIDKFRSTFESDHAKVAVTTKVFGAKVLDRINADNDLVFMVLPEVTAIKARSIMNFPNLSTIFFGPDLKVIPAAAIVNCPNLRNIYISNPETAITEGAIPDGVTVHKAVTTQGVDNKAEYEAKIAELERKIAETPATTPASLNLTPLTSLLAAHKVDVPEITAATQQDIELIVSKLEDRYRKEHEDAKKVIEATIEDSQKYNDLMSKYSVCDASLRTSKAKVAELEEKLNSSISRESDYENKLDASTRQCEELEAKLNAAISRESDYESKLDAATRRCEELEAKLVKSTPEKTVVSTTDIMEAYKVIVSAVSNGAVPSSKLTDLTNVIKKGAKKLAPSDKIKDALTRFGIPHSKYEIVFDDCWGSLPNKVRKYSRSEEIAVASSIDDYLLHNASLYKSNSPVSADTSDEALIEAIKTRHPTADADAKLREYKDMLLFIGETTPGETEAEKLLFLINS